MSESGETTESANRPVEGVPSVVDEGNRTPAECVQFTLLCLGIFLTIPGVIITSVWVTAIGLLLTAEALCYFYFKGS